MSCRMSLLSLAITACFGVLCLVSSLLAEDVKAAGKLRVYIGTSTGKSSSGNESKGIYASELDLKSGTLSEPMLMAETVGPSFLALHPDGKHLYAVGEISDLGGKKGGAINAFVIEDAKTGKLKALNQQSSGGAGPCHLVVDKTGKYVLAANYGGGSCCAIEIKPDGTLGEITSFVQHEGKGTDPGRQKEPHGHSINISSDNRFAFCADLGLDKVLVYKFQAGKLVPNDPPAANVAPGAGPRHFAFHPSGIFAYVINEMGNTVTGFTYDAAAGKLTEIQTIGTLPEGFKGESYTAEVVVHPSGKFLYGSNRGQDSLAIFVLDEKTGKLTAAGHQAEGIKWPRNFNVDPTGQYLVACNQRADSILVFSIDPSTGGLKPTGSKITVGQPVCVKFVPLP